MDERQRTFLANLVGASGPSGYEAAARAAWRDGIRDVATVQTDVHGSAIATVNPDGAPRVMLAGHLDEIGFMVSYDRRQRLYLLRTDRRPRPTICWWASGW